MPRLDNVDRHRAIGMLNAGMPAQRVAAALHVHNTTIYRLQERLAVTGTTSDRPRQGAPRVTTPRQDRAIRRSHLQDRFQTAAATARATQGQHGRPISRQTVRRRLLDGHLHCRRPYVGPVLTQRHRQARRTWAANGAFLGRHPWRDVIFSDESRFCVGHNDGRGRVYRRRGERFQDACIRERDRFGGPSVMVWGAITRDFRSPLVVINGNITAQRYIHNVLQPTLLPFLAQHGGPNRFIFQQDNATPHTARVTQQFLQQNGVRVMAWPAMSPDMNCIEHLWDILGRRIDHHVPRVQTRGDLIAALQYHWNNIPQQQIRRLVMSMPRRLQHCLAANGGHTRY
jgi:transposase